MGQTLITPTELTRRSLDIMHSNLCIVKNMDLQYEVKFAQSGYDGQKIGPTLQIRKPNQFTVRTDWPMAQQDMAETYASLTINTVRGVDLNFSDAELALSMDDFEKRYLEPAMKRLASEVDKVAGAYIKNHTPQCGGTVGTQPNTALIFTNAMSKLYNSLAPIDGDISAIICPDTQAVLIGGLTPSQVNPASTISQMFETGQISNMLGLKWYLSQVLSRHSCGTRTNVTPIVSGATEGTDGELTVTGAGASVTYLEGDVITAAGCYEINPETKQTLSYLKQFRITETCTSTAGGAVTLKISPALVVSGAYQNCSGYPTASGAITNVGTASYTYSNDILMHKKAFAFATAPLYVPKGTDMAATAEQDGIRIRFIRDYDSVNARVINRMDIFFGMVELRPEWAVRVVGLGV